MISKSPKEIYQTTYKRLQAEGVEIKEETIKEFNLFLFGKINNLLMSLETLELYVPQLGLWKFRRKKGEEFLAEIQNKPISQLLAGKFEQEKVDKAVETYQTRLSKLGNLINRHEEMIIARNEFKKIKDDFAANKRRTQGQEEDLGRTTQQDVEDGARGGDSSGETNNLS